MEFVLLTAKIYTPYAIIWREINEYMVLKRQEDGVKYNIMTND